MLGLSSKVLVLCICHADFLFLFFCKLTLSQFVLCSTSFQGNCLQNKDIKQRAAALCGMFDLGLYLIVLMKH